MDHSSPQKLDKSGDISNSKNSIARASTTPQNNSKLKKISNVSKSNSVVNATNNWFVSDAPISLMTGSHKNSRIKYASKSGSLVSKGAATTNWFVADAPITSTMSYEKNARIRKNIYSESDCVPITASATTTWFVTDAPSDPPSPSSTCFQKNPQTHKLSNSSCSDNYPITSLTSSQEKAPEQSENRFNINLPTISLTNSQENYKTPEQSKSSFINKLSSSSLTSSQEKAPEQSESGFNNLPTISLTNSQENYKTPEQSESSFINNLSSSSLTGSQEEAKTREQSESGCDNMSKSSSPISQDYVKTPRKSDIIWSDKPSTSSGTAASFSSCRPGTSASHSSLSINDKEKTPCAFYRIKRDKDGKEVFSKKLLKYFLNVDTPEMNDLKNKRFNTSFLHETPKPNREIKIFTEEEDNDPKYFENVPKFEVNNLPEVPGSLHADVFKSIPINESDEELKKVFKEASAGEPKGKGKKRRSTRITCYDGKPLPDQSLLFDYSRVFSADTTCEDTMNSKIKKENEMLRQKYKHILGDKQLKVVLTRLPETDLLKLCSKKDVSVKPQRKKRIPPRQKPKIRVSKRIKKKRGSLKPKRIRVSKRGKKILSKK